MYFRPCATGAEKYTTAKSADVLVAMVYRPGVEREAIYSLERLVAAEPPCQADAMPDQDDKQPEDAIVTDEHPELPSVVGTPTVALPEGYKYGVTRYADLILREAFPERFAQLVEVLEGYRIDLDELTTGGGGRASHTARFDATLAAHGWGKRNISISRLIDGKVIHETPGHEIDMFAELRADDPYPGIGVEMEWNNKDPFYDRDLLNFQALHHEGALAVGVIVTRGPRLQELIGPTIKTGKDSGSTKFGQSSTHWNKLIPRVNLGGGGECPLLLIGIEPERIDKVEILFDAKAEGTTVF